jgi:hypothetical protein
VDFTAVNFQSSWSSTAGGDNYLATVADNTVTVISAVAGKVGEHICTAAPTSMGWVSERGGKATAQVLLAVATDNAVTVYDALTWTTVATTEHVVEPADADDELRKSIPSCFRSAVDLCIVALCAFLRTFTVGINHIHCLEPGLLAVGYLNTSLSFEPSLALASFNRSGGVAVLSDLRDPVCTVEAMDAAYHRYHTQYIAQWYEDLPSYRVVRGALTRFIGLRCLTGVCWWSPPTSPLSVAS